MASDPVVERVEKLEKAFKSLAEMPRQMTDLQGRVGRLEVRVTSVELQIVQLRTEMRDGFSAVLEVVESDSHATQQLYDGGRAEMRELFKETWSHVRVLHEDLVQRIARIGEARS
jgi:hypothetical protein